MSKINFKAELIKIGAWTILKLPKGASAKLPSRGTVMIEGTINNFPFSAVLEPDGKGSHWFKVEKRILKGAGADVGDTVTMAVESSDKWLEPKVAPDLEKALTGAPQQHKLWKEITPMARWEWIRWISATRQEGTRKKRIEVALSKLKSGMRRPCCFNRNMCCDVSVCPRGVLSETDK